MNPGRRSKRYEDTESESEDPPQLPPQAPAPAHPEPDVDEPSEDDDERAAPGAAKKAKDPEANIRMWIPASIMRHVHPALVAEYEEKQAAKKAPKKRAAGAAVHAPDVPAEVPVPAPVPARVVVPAARRTLIPARAVPAPAAIPVAVPAALPTCISAAVPVVNPVPAPAAVQVAAVPAPAPAPTRARAPKGKGKAPARPTALEKEILRINPHASFAPPATSVDVFAASSLPLRNCGFVFTWPETDDPDALIVDTGARDDLPTGVDYAAVERAGGGAYREYDEVPVPAAKPRARRAPATTAAAASTYAIASAAPATTVGTSAISGPSAATGISATASTGPSISTARLQGTPMQTEPPVNTSTRKGKERAAPEPQNTPPAAASASVGPSPRGGILAQLDDWNMFGDYQAATSGTKRKSRASVSNSPAKRSRIDIDEMRDSSEEPDLPWQSSAPPARSSSPAYNPRSSPVPGPPPSSSPAPIRSASRSVSAASRRKAALDAEVISISSDSDGEGEDEAADDEREWWDMPMHNGQPSYYSQRKAASSQASLASPAAADLDDDVGMDVEDAWAVPVVPSVSAATPVGKRPQARPQDPETVKPPRVTGSTSSAGGARGRRVYRGEPVPSSSQESMLNEDVFFEDASLLIDLS